MEKEEYKKLSRIYVKDLALNIDAEINLEDAQVHYLKNVMRRNVGDNIRVFNGEDGEFIASISEMKKNNCVITISDKIAEQKYSKDIWAVTSVVKRDAFDLMAEKSSELGVSKFVPVETANSVVHSINHARLQSIAIEAAEQCERLDVAEVTELRKLNQVIDANTDRTFIICMERSESSDLKDIAEKHKTPLALVIGPEGGFSKDEANMLQGKKNVVFATLGENILRAETAMIAGLAILQAFAR